MVKEQCTGCRQPRMRVGKLGLLCTVRTSEVVITRITAGGMNSKRGGRLHVAVSILSDTSKYNVHKYEKQNTHLFRFAFVISFRRAAPSNGLRSSNAQSRSSDTLSQYPSDQSHGDFGWTYLMQAP